MHPFWRTLITCLALLLAQAGAPSASAQEPIGSSAVRIEVEQFGFGDAVRPGEWAGIRLRLTDSTPAPREVAVRMHLRDDDGDTLFAERRIVLNGNTPTGVWLYADMPWQLDTSTTFLFSVHEYDAGTAQIGRQLAITRLGPGSRQPGVIEPARPLIGIVGGRQLALGSYEMMFGGAYLPAHEHPRIVPGLLIETFPTHWAGLRQYDTIVWTDGEPAALGSSDDPSVRALRHWLLRGGHLVVVLPVVGGTWLTTANPLYSPDDGGLMPFVEIKRLDDESMEPYRALLSRGAFDHYQLPDRAVVQVFSPVEENPSPYSAMGLLAGKDGWVVTRRLVGNGMVTLIGMDLAHPVLAQEGAFRADAFWHRILGRRFDLPLPSASRLNQGGSTGAPEWADRYIAAEINWTATAGLGLLLALIVFGAYWIIAGPAGFAILKAYNRAHHAWLAFLATTALFTLIAWAGATAMKQNTVRARHFTVLDQVHGQGLQHARSWASVLLPSYGDVTLRIGDPDNTDDFAPLLATWSAGDSGVAQPFPDARPYINDARYLDQRQFPARATVKQVESDWLGPVRWRMPHAIAPGWAPRLDRPQPDAWELIGRIKHDLPAPIEDAQVILVTGQLTEAEERNARFDDRTESAMLAHAYIVNLTDPWRPADELDLSTLRFANAQADKYLSPLVLQDTMFAGGQDSARINGSDEIKAYRRLSLTGMLPAPIPDQASSKNPRPAQRRAAHALDLSVWFTQPCLIITGHVDDAPMPEPLRHGPAAREVPSQGRTFVRWVCPLEPHPVVFSNPPKDPLRSSTRERNAAADR